MLNLDVGGGGRSVLCAGRFNTWWRLRISYCTGAWVGHRTGLLPVRNPGNIPGNSSSVPLLLYYPITLLKVKISKKKGKR